MHMSIFVMVYINISVLGVRCAFTKKKTRFTTAYIRVKNSNVGDVVCHFQTGKKLLYHCQIAHPRIECKICSSFFH